MRFKKTIPNVKYAVSSLFMMLALAWLTVSLPFVYASQQAQKQTAQQRCDNQPEEEGNPLTNTTEEKASNLNTLSEYLHDTHTLEHPSQVLSTQYNTHSASLYLAFHPELVCPPPDAHVS